jgi:hypothetical protein
MIGQKKLTAIFSFYDDGWKLKNPIPFKKWGFNFLSRTIPFSRSHEWKQLEA